MNKQNKIKKQYIYINITCKNNKIQYNKKKRNIILKKWYNIANIYNKINNIKTLKPKTWNNII